MTDTPIEILIGGTINEEIATLRERQQRADDTAFRLQGEYDAAAAKADKTGDLGDVQLAENLHSRLMSAINTGTDISQKIETLRHPSELERRVNDRLAQTKRIGALRERSNTMAKESAKEQGFPDVYLNDKGGFRIGMDARAKSDLVASALGLVTKENPGAALHVFTVKEAEKLLTARDWTGFLDRKRQIVAEKQAATEKREQERAEAAKVKAEEKAKADAEKAAAKEAKAKEAAEAKAAKASASAADKATSKQPSRSSGSKADAARAQREAKVGG